MPADAIGRTAVVVGLHDVVCGHNGKRNTGSQNSTSHRTLAVAKRHDKSCQPQDQGGEQQEGAKSTEGHVKEINEAPFIHAVHANRIAPVGIPEIIHFLLCLHRQWCSSNGRHNAKV